MVIVVVVDCFVDKSNGTAVSANNLVKTLRQKGHIVRVVAPYVEGNGAYRVDERYIPFVTEISHKQHMHFGKADKKVLREAFDGADIIHFFLPFKLEIIGVKIAKEMKVPYICGFHLQPENITYNAKLVLKEYGALDKDRKAIKLGKIDNNTLYVTMTQEQKNKVTSQKVISFRDLVGQDILDPYGQNLDHYRSCAEQIYRGLEKLLKQLIGGVK